MDNPRFTFQFYDPFTDTKLDNPDQPAHYLDSRIPQGLPATVLAAKRMLGTCSTAEFERYTNAVTYYYQNRGVLGMRYLDQETERNYVATDEADVIKMGLSTEPPEGLATAEYPKIMAALALALAGTIHNHLWPSAAFQAEARRGTLAKHFSPYAPQKLQELALVAAKAVAIGQAFGDIQAAESAYRERNRQNAPKAHQPKHAIAERYVAWALNLKKPHQYSGISAATQFRDTELTPDEKPLASAHNFPRFLQQRLNQYIEENPETPHPFRK